MQSVRSLLVVSLTSVGLFTGAVALAPPAEAQIAAALPKKEAVPQSAPLPIDGVWRVSTINKRIQIEGGRAYMLDPWTQAFFIQVERDMVTLKDMQRLEPGAYIANDLPMQGTVQLKLASDGNIDASVKGANYRLLRVSVANEDAFQDELAATDFSSGGTFEGVTRTPQQQPIETWHVYVHKAWCTGRTNEVAFVNRAEGHVSVKAYRPGQENRPVTTRKMWVKVKCEKKFDKKTYGSEVGEDAVLVLTGTRDQIASYTLDYEYDFAYKPGSKGRTKTKRFSSPGALKTGLPVGENKTYKWFAGVQSRPDVSMDIRFKRIK